MPRSDIVKVDREEGLIEATLSGGEVIRRSLSYSDMISSLSFDDGVSWKKIEAIYYDPATNRIKVVYKA
jgi:hypothetical protein